MGVVRACVETLPGTDGGGIPEAWRTVFRTGVKVSAIPSECCPPWARNAVRHQIGKVSGMGRNAQKHMAADAGVPITVRLKPRAEVFEILSALSLFVMAVTTGK